MEQVKVRSPGKRRNQAWFAATDLINIWSH